MLWLGLGTKTSWLGLGKDRVLEKKHFFWVELTWIPNKNIIFVDPATFLASNSVQGTLFSSENSLFIQMWTEWGSLTLYCYLIYILIVRILSS